MPAKRILIVADDRLLANLYRERLEAAKFIIESAHTGDAAFKVIADRRPDAIVMDAATPAPDAPEFIARLRAGEHTRHLPIIVLPTARFPLAEAAQAAGATLVLARAANPIAELIDAIETALKLEPTASTSKSLAFEAGASWLKMSLEAAPAALNGMRRALQSISRDAHDRTALRELFQIIHNLAEQMSLLGQKPIFHLAAATEALAFDLVKLPEHSNPSVLRTLGQAVDFMAAFVAGKMPRPTAEPNSPQVLVVDDEDGARQIIMASMKFVGLTAVAADTPATALAALRGQSFDLIFLDVGLPQMSGFELCAQVRTLPLHEKTPIVFLTGMATFGNRVKSSLSGGNDFAGKPFSVPELGLKALLWVFKGRLGL